MIDKIKSAWRWISWFTWCIFHPRKAVRQVEPFRFSDQVKKNLPDWIAGIEMDSEGEKLVVWAETVYPKFLEILGYPQRFPTRTEIEVCRRVFTEYLKRKIVKTIDGKEAQLRIRIKSRPERIWTLDNYLPGIPINWEDEYKRVSDRIT